MSNVLSKIDIRRTINACGIYTDLGGSRLSPTVLSAMEDINNDFVQLRPLLDSTGQWIADKFGAESARVTPGAAAAIMLGTAACIAGIDGDRSEQLPDTTGLRNRVLIQTGHRYKYDRQVSMTGASLTEVGKNGQTTIDDLDHAMKDDVAMIIHPAHLDKNEGTIQLELVAEVAHKFNIPVFVDAAYMVYPTVLIGSYTVRGADLVAISAKYYGGPNAGGFIMGRRKLIEAVSNVHFTAYESGTILKFGRPLKMDRQIIVAIVVALDEWLKMDHGARHDKYTKQMSTLSDRLSDIPGLVLEPKCFTMDERIVDTPVNALLITVDEAVTTVSAEKLAAMLFNGTPCIACIQEDKSIAIVADVLNDQEIEKIGDLIHGYLSNL